MRKKQKGADRAIAAFRAFALCQASGVWDMDIRDETAVRCVLGVLSDADEEAVRAIYMASPSEHLTHGKISLRVKRYAIDAFVDESMVYRRLKRARKLFERARG